MYSVRARIVDGQAVSDELPLPEGKEVTIWVPEDEDEEGIHLTPEEEAELDAALEEADREEGIPAEQVLRELRELRLRDGDKR